MRFSTTIAVMFSATASLVAAQAKCQAQNILDVCVSGYQSRIDDCNQKPNDWICLCDAYKDVLVCYNNCPDSNEKPPVQNQVTQYCAAAAPLRASASASAASIASIAATQSHTPTSSSSTAEATASGSHTGTGSASLPTVSSFQGGAAASFGVPAGAALIAFLGAAGVL